MTTFDTETANQVDQLSDRAGKMFVIPFIEMDLAHYATPDDDTEPA